MADNVELNLTSGGNIISADQINTLNGVPISTNEKMQRVKLGFGIDGEATDVSSATPLPISGTITTKERPDATATYSPTNSTSLAYEASRVVKASAGTLYSITGYNSKTTSQFIQIHNTQSLPIDTAIPVVLFIVPANSNFSYSSDKFGRFFSNGITICNSSTGSTKTIGLPDVWFDIQYN